MRGLLRVIGFVVAAAVAAAAVFVGTTLPPAADRTPIARPANYLSGAYHVHTTRSDGAGTVADVAAAAARADLQFVILTDHGVGTRPPDPPTYYGDVLVVDAVELATTAGHVVALGIDEAPYPLGGEPRDVIDDVHRLGGIAIVAHPNSPKPDLRWRAWNTPYDGLEWLNADSEWRDESTSLLFASSLRQLMRPAETVVSLFDRPTLTLGRWDDRRRRAPVVGLAAVDAHGGVAPEWEDDRSRTAWAFGPDYEQMFRALVQVVVLTNGPTGDAEVDAADLVAAITNGRTYSVTRGVAAPPALDVVVRQGGETLGLGAVVEPGVEAELEASIPGSPGTRLVLVEDGQSVAEGQGSVTHLLTLRPGAVIRVEAYRPGTRFPWIMSRPVFARRTAPPAEPIAPTPPDRIEAQSVGEGWVIERDATSSGTTVVEDQEIRFLFAIGDGGPASPYAALVRSVESEYGFDRVVLTVRASRPLRFSVQARLPGPGGGQRWGRSVYVDETSRSLELPFGDFRPLDGPSGQQPIEASVRAVLFVVDTVNSAPGARGTIWLSGVGLGVGPSSASDGGAASAPSRF